MYIDYIAVIAANFLCLDKFLHLLEITPMALNYLKHDKTTSNAISDMCKQKS